MLSKFAVKGKICRTAFAVLMMGGLMWGGSFNSQAQVINPWCPNGCVAGDKGCFCYNYYPYYTEFDWGQIDQ